SPVRPSLPHRASVRRRGVIDAHLGAVGDESDVGPQPPDLELGKGQPRPAVYWLSPDDLTTAPHPTRRPELHIVGGEEAFHVFAVESGLRQVQGFLEMLQREKHAPGGRILHYGGQNSVRPVRNR